MPSIKSRFKKYYNECIYTSNDYLYASFVLSEGTVEIGLF